MKSPAALILLAAACGPPPPPASGLQPRQVLEGFTLRRSNSGTTSWSLSAKLALLDDRSRIVSLVEPRLEFFSDSRLASKVSSLKGTSDLAGHDVHLSSSVVVNSLEDGAILTSEELTYDSRRQKILTPGRVRLKRAGVLVQGFGLEADPQLTQLRIFHQETVVDKKQ